MPVKFKETDRGWSRIRKVFDGKQPSVKVGIQGAEAEASRGKMTNVALAVVHEFGVTIHHPGGTPFIVSSMGGSSRSGGMVGYGAVRFVSKDYSNPIGVTAAHDITIPERSFVRGPFNAGLPKYGKILENGSGKVLSGKMTKDQLLGILGEVIKADMQNAISQGIDPPLKAATIRRREKQFGKASSKPLIATGQLRQSITWVLAKT